MWRHAVAEAYTSCLPLGYFVKTYRGVCGRVDTGTEHGDDAEVLAMNMRVRNLETDFAWRCPLSIISTFLLSNYFVKVTYGIIYG